MQIRVEGTGHAITMSLETITPAQAAAWLSNMAPRQRKLRQSRIERYRQMMGRNHWMVTHQGIALDLNGRLLDGQHRLHAIVALGVPVTMLVFRGLDPDVYLALDEGLPRRFHDVAPDEWMRDSRVEALVRAFMRGPNQNVNRGADTDRAVLVDVLRKHKDALTSAIEWSNPKLTTVVVAVVARAYYHIPQEQLIAFLRVLATGVTPRGELDLAAVTLSRALQEGTLFSARQRQDVYRKAQRALKAFADGEPLSKIYGSPNDLFPLAETL